MAPVRQIEPHNDRTGDRIRYKQTVSGKTMDQDMNEDRFRPNQKQPDDYRRDKRQDEYGRDNDHQED